MNENNKTTPARTEVELAINSTVFEIVSHLKSKKHSIQDARDVVKRLSVEIEEIVNHKSI
jgi:hypothetical protein